MWPLLLSQHTHGSANIVLTKLRTTYIIQCELNESLYTYLLVLCVCMNVMERSKVHESTSPYSQAEQQKQTET